jgi:hypothetical protein
MTKLIYEFFKILSCIWIALRYLQKPSIPSAYSVIVEAINRVHKAQK